MTSMISADRLTELTGLWLPEDARVDAILITNWQDQRVAARATVDSNQLQAFMKRLPRDSEVSRTDRFGISSQSVQPRPDWWTPDEVTDFTAIKWPDDSPQAFLRLLIDRRDDETTVYIFEPR